MPYYTYNSKEEDDGVFPKGKKLIFDNTNYRDSDPDDGEKLRHTPRVKMNMKE